MYRFIIHEMSNIIAMLLYIFWDEKSLPWLLLSSAWFSHILTQLDAPRCKWITTSTVLNLHQGQWNVQGIKILVIWIKALDNVSVYSMTTTLPVTFTDGWDCNMRLVLPSGCVKLYDAWRAVGYLIQCYISRFENIVFLLQLKLSWCYEQTEGKIFTYTINTNMDSVSLTCSQHIQGFGLRDILTNYSKP